jgi:Starch-binding associating with outer membrane
MKYLSKIYKNKAKVAIIIASTIFAGCSDYLDVDTDTDNPVVAPINLLLPNIQQNAALVGDFNLNSGQNLAVYTHSMCDRGEADNYDIKVGSIPMSNDWNAIYLTLTNVETLIQQGTQGGHTVYTGIGQLYKAYLMSVAVDLWGDVPFTEANRLKDGIISPKYDNQKEIYDAVFKLIDDAKVNLNMNQGTSKPGTDDLVYGGSRTKWIKFANTLKLKLYNQTRLTTTFDQTGFDALIAENNFFTSNADDFQFKHYDVKSPQLERNQMYRDAYESTQFGLYQSPWFYEIIKGMNPNIHSGNPDPREKYYFYNQLVPGELPENALGSDPRADYWDKSTGFFSIRFGSTGPDRDRGSEASYTYPGIFPAGGLYDNGAGLTITDDIGTGKAPRRILTYDEYLYIRAELIQVGKITGNAETTLRSAIDASMAKVDQVVLEAKKSGVTVPTLVGSTSVTNFVNNVITEFSSANSSKKLEIIMTQKWVGTYGDALDQYNDYRRTGFPVLADPNSTTPEYQVNNADGFPIDDAQTVLSGAYQLSWFWPQSEANTNVNAPAQKNPTTYKIFWDN